jgi:hypothetical protein
MVQNPTHIRDRSANILDLLITDSPGYITNQNQDTLPPIGSIHQIVYAEIKIQYRRDKPYLRETWNYGRGDYVGLSAGLKQAPWDQNLALNNDIDISAMHFTTVLWTCVNQKSLTGQSK